jgi:hypothetical protein
MHSARQLAGIMLEADETAKQFISRHVSKAPGMSPAFFHSYVEAALWSSIDDAGDSLEGHDIAPETEKEMESDCRRFWKENYALIEDDPARAGHDFWLTRNHHGAGFWDGDWPDDLGNLLTKRAHAFGEQNLYVADDGLVYT